jgi:hypothetical protein
MMMSRDVKTLAGIVTDRDACMAAYLQCQPLHCVPVNDLALAMAKGRDVSAAEVAETLAAICEHRPSAPVVTAM